MSQLSRSTRYLAVCVAALALASVAACSSDKSTGTPVAAAVVVSAGQSQTVSAGGAVAVAPSVVVRDGSGNPVTGFVVTFAVTSGGGSITGASATSNASGIAAVGSWTLGTTAGVNTLTATAPGLTGSPITFTATATAGAAAAIAVNAGNNQSAAGGAAVAVAPSVLVTDAHANPVSGVSVTFAIASGGGSLTGGTATTNASGIATLGSWTLGASVGANTLTATATGLTGSPLTFTATAGAGTAAQIAVNLGNAQTATVGTAVANAPSIIVKDVHDNPVAGYSVTFVVASGSGSVTGATVSTDASGVAAVGSWTLGGTAGGNTLTVTATGLTGSPVTFTATGTVGSASSIALNLGNGQTATVATAVAIAPSVLVADAHANPVSGVTVEFAVATGGGSVSGGTAVTDANGIATATSWTLGNAAGSNTLTATSTGLTNSPITFTATGTAGDAATIAMQQGSGQSATVGTAVAVPPGVLVTDAHGNPVSGVAVTFSVATGGGSVTSGNSTSDANGLAKAGSWQLGTTAGANSLRASATGLTGSPVTFTASGTADVASQIAVNGGDNQSATHGTNVAVAPTVIVKDQYGNPVSGVAVTFAVWDGGGSIGTAFPTTNASGIASVGSWTLGSGVGANHLHATVNGLAGSPVTFTATATASVATQIALNAGNSQSAVHGTAVAIAPSVIVKDAGGNPVSGVTVTFAVATGGGSVTGASASSNASGIATIGSWTLGSAIGANTITATATGLTGSPVTFTATATVGAAATVAVNAGNNQTAGHDSLVAIAPSVIVRDGGGAPVSGVSVTFAVASGGGSITGASATTNASGIATVGSWTLGSAIGSNTMTATSGSLTGSPVTFTATSSCGTARLHCLIISAGNNQHVANGGTVAIAPAVEILAGSSTGFNHTVTFTITTGGGTLTGGTGTTTTRTITPDPTTHIATLGSWTVGNTTGTHTLTVTMTSGAPAETETVIFTATSP